MMAGLVIELQVFPVVLGGLQAMLLSESVNRILSAVS